MQKFFGFDSTIGVGRNFGFKAGEVIVLPPLEKPVITSVGEDMDMGGVRLEFAQFGDFDSFTIYRSTTPMDIASLPAPIAAGLTTMYYVDSTIVDEQSYYYRVGVVRDGVELVSDEMQYIPAAAGSVIPTDYILAYDFNGDVLDKSLNALNGIRNGSTVFSTGRKAGTQALEFISGAVVTPQALPINSDKLTVSFWLSTSQSSPGYIYEQDFGGDTAYCAINFYVNNGIQSKIAISGLENVVHSPIAFDNSYQHILIEIDKSQPALSEQKIYVNNVLSSVQLSNKADTSGLFDNKVLFIGRGNNGSYPLVGRLQDMRFYNRVLTEFERAQLFNE